MIVKLLTEHHLEFLSLTGGCTDLSEFTLVKMPHCWKSHAHLFVSVDGYLSVKSFMFDLRNKDYLLKKTIPHHQLGSYPPPLDHESNNLPNEL